MVNQCSVTVGYKGIGFHFYCDGCIQTSNLKKLSLGHVLAEHFFLSVLLYFSLKHISVFKNDTQPIFREKCQVR